MHVANSQENLAYVKHRHIITKSTIFPQSIEEFPSRTKLKDHVNESLILERGLQRVDEGVIELG